MLEIVDYKLLAINQLLDFVRSYFLEFQVDFVGFFLLLLCKFMTSLFNIMNCDLFSMGNKIYN